MKVKVISRNPDVYLRETKHDIQKGESIFFATHMTDLTSLFLF